MKRLNVTISVIALAIGLGLAMFTACEKPDDNGNGTEEPGTDPGTDPGTTPTTWTVVENTAFGNSTIRDIAFGNGKFVAVGHNGKIAYSADGVNWTAVANTTFPSMHCTPERVYEIQGVGYGNGKFVAVGQRNKIAYSTDGVTWTQANSAAITDYNDDDVYEGLSDVVYCGDKFVAFGSGRSGVHYSTGKVVMGYSTDGITWTNESSKVANIFKTDPYTPPHIYNLAYGNNTLVAIGLNGGSPHYKIAYSTDNGASWQETTEGTSAAIPLSDITYGNGKFVTVGVSRRILHSTNGINWTEIPKENTGLSSGNLICVTCANGKFIAGGENGSMIYAANGENWTKISYQHSGTVQHDINGIAYGAGKTVAVGRLGQNSYIMYCND
jgi:hypothetical protein